MLIKNSQFNWLKIIKPVKKDTHGKVFYKCKCALCGGYAIVRGDNIVSGHTKSCGCLNSYKEMVIAKALKSAKIRHAKQFTFADLRSDKNALLRFDFAIFNNKNQLVCLIEYQGFQHYEKRFNITEEEFKRAIARDEAKRQYCKDNNITLVEWNKDNDIDAEIAKIAEMARG